MHTKLPMTLPSVLLTCSRAAVTEEAKQETENSRGTRTNRQQPSCVTGLNAVDRSSIQVSNTSLYNYGSTLSMPYLRMRTAG